MVKKFKNENGSTLVLTIFIFAVLSLLGTTVLGITMTNYKMKLVNTKSKQSFYLSEAGLEEVYANVCNLVDDAYTAANTSAAAVMTSFDYDEELLKETSEIDSDFIIQDEKTKEYILDEEFISSEMDRVFKLVFEDMIEDEIVTTIKETSNITYNSTSPAIEIVTENPQFSEGILDVEIKSSFINEGIKRTAKVVLSISEDKYIEPYYVKESTLQIPYNPVWTKALCADGNIFINRGNVAINGDIYSKGTPSSGIIINNGKEENNNYMLKVKGNVITKNDILFNDSDLIVNFEDSNIYSRNIILNSNASNSSIVIGGSVYLPDDLEINGLNQSVRISGDFYGFSDGSIESVSYESSSIIINSDDLGEGTNLRIKGDALIYGTSYIDTINGKYQTGESVSIKGNYIAYTYPLTIEEAERGSEKQSLKSDNVKFKYYNPLVLVDRFVNDAKLNVFDKKDYFYFYNEETSSSGLNLGERGITDGISIEGTARAIGAIIHDNTIGMDDLSELDYQDKLDNCAKEYDKMTLQMGDDTINVSPVTISTQVNFRNNKDKSKEININDLTVKEIYHQSKNQGKAVWLRGKDYDEILNINPNTNRIINLNEDNVVYKGLIIANGDIYLTGDFTLDGSIIANGNIYIDAYSKININYDQNFILKMINEYELVKEDESKSIFTNNSTGKPAVYTYEVKYNNDLEPVNTRPEDLIRFKNWQISYDK